MRAAFFTLARTVPRLYRLFLYRPKALPESKKSLAAEMFWVTFRLHAGLPLTPRDPHVGEDGPRHFDTALASLFERNEERNAHFDMALLLLCSFAEGRFDRPKKSKKAKVRHLPSRQCLE